MCLARTKSAWSRFGNASLVMVVVFFADTSILGQHIRAKSASASTCARTRRNAKTFRWRSYSARRTENAWKMSTPGRSLVSSGSGGGPPCGGRAKTWMATPSTSATPGRWSFYRWQRRPLHSTVLLNVGVCEEWSRLGWSNKIQQAALEEHLPERPKNALI